MIFVTHAPGSVVASSVQRRASSVITYDWEERRHHAGRAAAPPAGIRARTAGETHGGPAAEDGGAPAVNLENVTN